MSLTEMKKNELVEMIEDMECCLSMLEDRVVQKEKIKKQGRKEEVHDCLVANGKISVGDIAVKVGISARNVSSQLSYLRRDGVNIATDSKGRKFIEE